MIDFRGKSILFISPSFFGYERSIEKRLKELGAFVDYFDERPANTFWTKAFIRFNTNLVVHKIKKYYNCIENKIKDNKYDYVFVLNIEAMPILFLKKLRMLNPSANFILYMWDSIFNKKNTINYISLFDCVFSFDANDCQRETDIKFRPLFYLNEYKEIAKNANYEYDFVFIGTAHSDRFSLICDIQQQIMRKGMRTYWFLYLQSRKLFFWNKINNEAFNEARVTDFNYKPLSQESILNIIKKTKIVLDIQHPMQSGLTMRTFEMLGARRKLVTTNSNIQKYDFYLPDNILVIDRNKPLITDSFCSSKYIELPNEIYYKYSLDGWLEELFS